MCCSVVARALLVVLGSAGAFASGNWLMRTALAQRVERGFSPATGMAQASALQMHLNDDIKASYGNTAAAPDFWCEWDTAAAPDEWACTSTDCDGAGADCVVMSVGAGSTDFVLIPPSGLFTIRSRGGVAGTDELDIQHDGVTSRLLARDSGGMTLQTTAGTHLTLSSAGTTTMGASVVFSSTARFDSARHQDSVPTITLAAAATTFAATRNHNKIDCDGLNNTIATITGDQPGMEFCMEFIDSNCIITDDGTAAADTINLNAAFTSTADDILCLKHNGTSWRESSRSVN